MACVQGTWWGVGGGVVGGWWGFWFWGLVSGSGRVLGLGCLVGGGVCLVGPGSWLVCGVTCGGLFPLDPSLTPPPAAWCAVVLGSGRPSVGWGCCLLLAVLWVAVLFWGGGLVLRVACLAGCVLVGLFSAGGVWLLFLLAAEVRPSVCWGLVGGCGLCGLCVCRGVVLLLAVLFPLGGPTWTVGLFVAPLFLPPRYTTGLPNPPNPVGKLTR